MRTIVLVLFLLAVALPVTAQESPPEGCAPSDLHALLDEASAALDQPDVTLDTVIGALISALQDRRALCSGLTFDGATGGVVVGPFTLPAGNWLHQGSFTDYAVTNIETITPECRSQLIGGGLTSSSREAYIDQTFIQTDRDCRLVIEVTASKPWTLNFTPIQ